VLVLKVLDADPGTSAARPKQVGLWLDHMFINTFLITNAAWQELEAYVYDCAAGPATLLIRCDRVWHAPGDPRALGIALNDEVSWRTAFNGSAQGLSAWHANTEGAGPAQYRWTEQNAALRVAVPDSDRITLAMRVPARVPFYRTRVSVDVFIDGKFCRRVVLPRSPARWVHESFIVDQQLRGQRALLSLKVSRLSTVRAAGTFSGARAGIALAVE